MLSPDVEATVCRIAKTIRQEINTSGEISVDAACFIAEELKNIHN